MPNNLTKGFSVVELIVTIGISSLIMATVVFNYGASNAKFAVSSSAQEVAITIRQSQAFSLSVKEAGVGTGQFSYGYGVYFNPGVYPGSFYLFIDQDRDYLFDIGTGCGTGTTECLEKIDFRDGVTLTNVEYCHGAVCTPYPSGHSLHVSFLRPNPDPIITYTNGSGVIVTPPPIPGLYGRVSITSPRGQTSYVQIHGTGQILVQ